MDMESAKLLISEIVISGIKDLRNLYKRYYSGRVKSPAARAEILMEIAEEEKFLRTTWMLPFILPQVTGEDIIKKLKKEVDNDK